MPAIKPVGPYEEGYVALKDHNADEHSNPYQVDSAAWHEWHDGWVDALMEVDAERPRK